MGSLIIAFIERNHSRSRERKFKDEAADIVSRDIKMSSVIKKRIGIFAKFLRLTAEIKKRKKEK